MTPRAVFEACASAKLREQHPDALAIARLAESIVAAALTALGERP